MATTFFNCPHCRKSLGVRSGARGSLMDIGPPVITCPNCKRSVQTGGQEWADMPKSRRAKILAETYIYVGLVLGPLLGVLAAGILHELLGLSAPIAILLGIAVWIAAAYRSHRIHREEVRESLERKPTTK